MRVNKDEEALWNGHYGGEFIKLSTTEDESLYAFMRRKDDSEVITVVNLSEEPKTITFKSPVQDTYESIFNTQILSVFTNGEIKLGPWGYQVFRKTNN
jgi:cyclomaltodextrinase